MPRSLCEKENVQLVQELAEVDGPFESPININFRDLIKLELPPLTWNKPDSAPKKLKITNTGHTVIISGKWKCERPYLTGGPLDGKYVFSQIHFHWGPDNYRGSEHQVSGESFPLEMHVTHFKTEYMTQESALREKDGMVVLVYLFKLQEEPNSSLKKIIGALPCIKQPTTSYPLECRSILALCNPFTDDYFMYWGSIVTSTCAHILLWVVCREPFGISKDQMEEFRKMLDASKNPIRCNHREPQPLHKRNVFHVNASRRLDEPMLPIKNIVGCFCSTNTESIPDQKKSGDGCSCNQKNGFQEELQDKLNPEQQDERHRGNGVYLQQTVYFQHATVHSVPALKKFAAKDTQLKALKGIEEKPEEEAVSRETSQSCCFFSAEDKKNTKENRPKRERKRRRKTIDSVTTLANLIDTLETLKTQTYRKLKEIESINHEIRGMKSSCERLEERQWLRHAEKMMSRQKRLTLRSSQCCFNDLKKLAKECHFDRLLNENVLSDNTPFFLGKVEPTNLCSDDKVDTANFCNHEKFSRKSQKLIQSFFANIQESEEAQISLERNLMLKKLQMSGRVDGSLPTPDEMHITKNMLNVGPIRDRFFTEVTAEEKTPKKKKKKGFFRISLSGFESDEYQNTLLNKSALDWLSSRFSNMSGTSPVIPLRVADFELKTALKETKLDCHDLRESISGEHTHTEMAGYVSESLDSEFNIKSDTSRKLSVNKKSSEASDRNCEKSFVRVTRNADFFSNSTNVSSNESNDRISAKVVQRLSLDFWRDNSLQTEERLRSSDLSEHQKEFSSNVVSSKDVGVDATEDKPITTPVRRKLKLEWKCRSVDVQSEIKSGQKVSFVETECQADLNPMCNTMESQTDAQPGTRDVPVEANLPLSAIIEKDMRKQVDKPEDETYLIKEEPECTERKICLDLSQIQSMNESSSEELLKGTAEKILSKLDSFKKTVDDRKKPNENVDSNASIIKSQQIIMSRENSLTSNEDVGQSDSSVRRIDNIRKPLSVETISAIKKETKLKKRRPCVKKKPRRIVRNNHLAMRKVNRIDFTNLTEEEQLRIISANVARFVRQKLFEHEFFDFDKDDHITFDIVPWSKNPSEEEMTENVTEGEKASEEKKNPEPTIEEVEKTEKIIDNGKKTENPRKADNFDFIKRNKILAATYKRRTRVETNKKGTKPKEKQNKEPEKKECVTLAPSKPPGKESNTKTTSVVTTSEGSTGKDLRTPPTVGRPPKSVIPVLQTRNGSTTPKTPLLRTRQLTLQRPTQPKNRLVPTYTLTSYMSPPKDVLDYRKSELDKFLQQSQELCIENVKNRKSRLQDELSKKNLDHLIMLQKKINHEISANIENSMNYVKTLLSQDYNGTAIIEKAPVKNSFDVFDHGGIVFIEVNDQFECSSSSSEFSEESGIYCIHPETNGGDRNGDLKQEAIVKRNCSGDSGLVDSRIFEELQNDTDSSYNCEVSIVVEPNDEKYVNDVLHKYIYHLEDKPSLPTIIASTEETRKTNSDHAIALSADTSETSIHVNEGAILSAIADVVKKYLDECEKEHLSENAVLQTDTQPLP